MKDFKNLRIKRKLCIIKIYLLALILIIINLTYLYICNNNYLFQLD